MGSEGRKELKNARKAKHMTQQQLAEALGLATGTIQQYELGKRNPPRKTVEKIAKILGVSPMDIIGDGDEVYLSWIDYDISSDELHEIYQRKRNRLINAFDKLCPDGQTVAVERVAELTEIPRYRAETALESTPPPAEGKDTTSPQKPPETPPEGK